MSKEASSGTFRRLPTLARRVLDAGPLSAEDAVRLGASLCRAIEALHAKKERHGALGPAAVRLPAEDLKKAVVKKPAPLQKRTGEDVDAIARIVHFALTGQETKLLDTPSSVAELDGADAELDAALSRAWSDAPTVTTVSQLREHLEAWLEEKTTAMPWDERGFEPSLELSALPPPPVPESVARRAPSNPRESFDFEEERPTLPGLPLKSESEPRRPRLVPPKLNSPPKRKAKAKPKDAAEHAEEVEPMSESAPSRPWKMVAVFGVAAVVAAGYAWVSTRDHAGAPPRPGGSASPDTMASTVTSTSAAATSAHPAANAPSSATVGPAPSESAELLASVMLSASASAGPSASASAFALPSASASALPSASSSASALASTSAKVAADAADATHRCIAGAFPADTFAGTFTDLSPVCSQKDVVQGAQDLRLMIVRAGTGRSVTAGMKEWSLMGTYELPAFAIIQNRCCAGATVTVPSGPDGCPMSLESAIRALEVVDLGVKKLLDKSINDLDRAIRCIERSGGQKRFGGHKTLSGGEVTPFRKLVARLPAKPIELK